MIAVPAGCRSDYEIAAIPPAINDDLVCTPTPVDRILPVDNDRGFGAAGVFLARGTEADQDTVRYTALGAPDPLNPDGRGFVQITRLRDGRVDRGAPEQVLDAEPGVYSFGASLLAADLVACADHVGCGTELLVGAPDYGTHSTGGSVVLYRVRGEGPPDGYFPDPWKAFGEVFPPAHLLADAEFGHSLAVIHDWDHGNAEAVAPLSTSYILVGAPGADSVQVYAVDQEAADDPLTWVGELLPPGELELGRSFGWSLATGDLNGDGWTDLAVGAPFAAGIGEGVVVVFEGVGAPPDEVPFLPEPAAVLVGQEPLDEFGYSLDAGFLFAAENGVGPAAFQGLVVGAPGYNSDDGRVCAYRLVDGAGGPLEEVLRDCDSVARYSWAAWAKASREGASLSVGNFVNADAGFGTGGAALLDEIAVGLPFSTKYNPHDGAVLVYLSGLSGPNWQDLALQEFGGKHLYTGGSVGSGSGEPTGWVDLLIGAPADPHAGGVDGSVLLTRAEKLGGAAATCADADGRWGLYGSTILAVSSTDTNTKLTFPYGLIIPLVHEGEICTFNGTGEMVAFVIPPGTHIDVDPFGCPGTCSPVTSTSVPVGEYARDALEESGVWDDLTEEERALQHVKADVTLTLTDASCGAPGELLVDVQTPDALWSFAGPILGFDQGCRPDVPVSFAPIPGDLCEY